MIVVGIDPHSRLHAAAAVDEQGRLLEGIQVGSDETLNQFAYPREDDRGRQEGSWLASAVERAEALLADVRLDRPEG